MPYVERVCANCKEPFTARLIGTQPERGKFCSLACFHEQNTQYKRSSMACLGCGAEFIPNKTQARAMAAGRQHGAYCSTDCYRQHLTIKRLGKKNPHWKGGKVQSYGYKYLHKPGYHETTKYVAEHRKVMEEALGRKMEAGEVVHHKNGNRDDNRLENLEVLTISEHIRMHNLERSAKRHGFSKSREKESQDKAGVNWA